MKQIIMTVDLEYDWRSQTTNSLELVPNLLDLFRENDIRATFFVVADLIRTHKKTIKDIAKHHEIASHSYSHPNLGKLSVEELENELKSSKQEIENLGTPCYGFRAPYAIPHPQLGNMLVKHGYKYDSSISSFIPGRFMHLKTPGHPYKASEENLVKPGTDIIELPIPNLTPFKFPPAGLFYYRFFHPLSKVFQKPYMFYLHLHEFEKTDYAKAGMLTKLLYSRNIGKKAWDIFTEFIKSSNAEFISCKEHLKSQGLL